MTLQCHYSRSTTKGPNTTCKFESCKEHDIPTHCCLHPNSQIQAPKTICCVARCTTCKLKHGSLHSNGKQIQNKQASCFVVSNSLKLIPTNLLWNAGLFDDGAHSFNHFRVGFFHLAENLVALWLIVLVNYTSIQNA